MGNTHVGQDFAATHYYNTLAEIPPDGRMGLFDEVAGRDGSPAAHYSLYAVYAASGFQHNSWNATSRTEHPSTLCPSRPESKGSGNQYVWPAAGTGATKPPDAIPLQIPASALRA